MEFIISLIPLSLIIIFFIALLYKFYVKFVAIFAFPTYLVLFSIEYIAFNNKNLAEKKLYRLNLPKRIVKKTSMNTIASIITIINLYIIDKYILFFNTINDDLINKLKKILFIDYRVVLVIIFLILIIYMMSYFEEIDERTGIEKIVDLKIPFLWKEVIKD